uniref:ATP-binding protein n=1 Tax=Roseivirga sp. TaxID=1964215 RepID=UPI00404867AA
MIKRAIEDKIRKRIGGGKAIVIIGPRQVGKTTLINSILGNDQFLFLDCDDPTVRSLLTNSGTEQLKSLIGTSKFVFIDEAQRIQNIGLTLKIIIDQIKPNQLFVSGSSAFELANELREPLTGRKWEYELYPISWDELEKHMGFLKSEQQLNLRLIYGMYPDVINNVGDETEVLKELVNSYLYRDLLAFGGIKKPQVLERLMRALAFQIGNEFSYNELSNLLEVDKNTVNSYMDLLEKGFVIYRLPSFSKNLRNEIKMNRKAYFYDNGIRNMIIGDFRNAEARNDMGALWENFIITERIKNNQYYKPTAKSYFWRTKQQQEVDYVEEFDGEISGYEIKWNPNAKFSPVKNFMETYNASIKKVSRDNFRDFLSTL